VVWGRARRRRATVSRTNKNITKCYDNIIVYTTPLRHVTSATAWRDARGSQPTTESTLLKCVCTSNAAHTLTTTLCAHFNPSRRRPSVDPPPAPDARLGRPEATPRRGGWSRDSGLGTTTATRHRSVASSVRRQNLIMP